uniref:Uncharacterized protein n=1 Tax=Rhizophora mucronata TaxID=61149 RepID=A0A2P2P0M8_RHIMU
MVDPIHGVATRVKCKITNSSRRIDVANSGEFGHLVAGNVAVLAAAGILKELAGKNRVKIRHAHLHGVDVIVVIII